MAKQVKTIKLPASSTRSWLTRPIFVPSMDSVINKWQRKGWRHVGTESVSGFGQLGRTSHFLLTFERD